MLSPRVQRSDQVGLGKVERLAAADRIADQLDQLAQRGSGKQVQRLARVDGEGNTQVDCRYGLSSVPHNGEHVRPAVDHRPGQCESLIERQDPGVILCGDRSRTNADRNHENR